MSANNDSFGKTIFIAVALCLVCSLLVSGAAVVLKEEQQVNKVADIRRSILSAAGLVKEGEQVDINALYDEKIDARVIDLKTGEFVSDVEAAKFDQRQAARNPGSSEKLSKDQDIASIKRLEHHAKVYLVQNNGQLQSVILPVRGYGLFSTLHGFVALKADTQTVTGLKFYEHGETPGLGAEIENPAWIAKWPGKKVLGDDYQPVIKLVKTGASNDSEVDALSGATYTSRGVENLLTFWLGKDGFGPFLKKIRGGNHGV